MRTNFFNDRCGAIAIIFAALLIPLMGLAAMGFDLTRIYVAQTRMQSALDAAGLAAGTAYGREEADIRRIAGNYFDRNYGSAEWLPAAAIDININDNAMVLAARSTFKPTFLSSLGFEQFIIDAATEIVAEPTGLEVVLVLDVTRSMNEMTSGLTRIQSLRNAAHDLIDILSNSASRPDLVKFGIVPYSASVNIGSSNGHYVEGVSASAFPGTDWGGCVMARRDGEDLTDNYLPGSSSAAGKWPAYRWPNEPNQIVPGGANVGYCDNPTAVGSPSNYAQIVDIFNPTPDFPPRSAGPNRSCPQPLVPLTSDHERVRDRIDELEVIDGGGTMSIFGAAWGWRLLSPNAPFSEGAAYNDDDWRKILIVMTDGEQNLSKNADDDNNSCSSATGVSGTAWTHDPANYGAQGNSFAGGPAEHWTAYGYPMSSARFGSSDYSTVIGALESRFNSVCNNIKNVRLDGQPIVDIYTLTFGDGLDMSARSLVRSCASNSDHYFHAPTGLALEQAFSEIAYDILNTRITK